MANIRVNQAVPIFPNAGNTIPNGTLFVSASRAAAAYNSDEHVNPFCKGIRLYITNDGAGGSTATVKLQVRSPGGSFTDLAGATSAALGAVTASIVTIYPGLTGIADAAGVTINQHLGLIWRAVLTIGVATGTSKVEADYLV
jgi:hypothetical protein